jgi:hypothetical protein
MRAVGATTTLAVAMIILAFYDVKKEQT